MSIITLPLVSVIVPIYNVENYLKKCIDSILCQTYSNLEIILVNDGSTDNSLEICNSYKDDRIIILNKENGGLSSARNSGLEVMTGEYIFFLDSDDWIEDNCIEYLLGMIVDKKVDIVQCEFEKVYTDEYQKINNSNDFVDIYSNLEFLNNIDLMSYVVVWNKLYKANLWKNIRFPEGKIHEDAFTTYKIAYQANKIAISPKILVFYRQRPNSIMSQTYSPSRLDLLEALEEKVFFMKDINNELYSQALIHYSSSLIHYFQLHLQFRGDEREVLRKLKMKAKKYNKAIWKNKIPIEIKVKSLVFCYFYTVFQYSQRLYRKVKYRSG